MNLFENLQKLNESNLNVAEKRLDELTTEEIDKLPEKFLCKRLEYGEVKFRVIYKKNLLENPDEVWELAGLPPRYRPAREVFIATSKDVDTYEKSKIDPIKDECKFLRKYLID